jgi:hypothetical protein
MFKFTMGSNGVLNTLSEDFQHNLAHEPVGEASHRGR